MAERSLKSPQIFEKYIIYFKINHESKKKITRKIRTYFELNKNESKI